MKRFLVLLLAVLMFAFCGCSKDSAEPEIERTDYSVNDSEEITIGVIAPLSSDASSVGNDVLNGVTFANDMASSVNIDKKYHINISVCDSDENIEDIANKFISEKVAAVICYGSDYEKTNKIIEGFNSVTTPLLFVDSQSNMIAENSTSMTLSASATYKASVIASCISNDGHKDGVILFEDNDYCKDFADSFKTLLSDSYGVDSDTAVYANDTDLEISVEGKDYVLVIGNNEFSADIANEVKGLNADLPVYLTEMYKKYDLADSKYDNTFYLSKFETDENNHYVTDFLNVYTSVEDVAKAEVSSAVAYGYDAYMLIYGALGSLNPNSISGSLDAVKNGSEDNTESVTKINSSQVYDAIVKEGKVYAGPIDTIVFDSDGYLKPSYVYLDGVENGTPYMVNKFVY